MKKQNKRCMLFGLTCLLFTLFVLMTDLTSVMAVNGSGKRCPAGYKGVT